MQTLGAVGKEARNVIASFSVKSEPMTFVITRYLMHTENLISSHFVLNTDFVLKKQEYPVLVDFVLFCIKETG